jgi:hypothetical protein
MSHGPLFYDKGLELLLQARIFIDTACDCEVVLLIIKYEKENLEEKNKLLENEIQSEREEKKNGVLTQPTSFSLPSSSGGTIVYIYMYVHIYMICIYLYIDRYMCT